MNLLKRKNFTILLKLLFMWFYPTPVFVFSKQTQKPVLIAPNHFDFD